MITSRGVVTKHGVKKKAFEESVRRVNCSNCLTVIKYNEELQAEIATLRAENDRLKEEITELKVSMTFCSGSCRFPGITDFIKKMEEG